MKTELVIFDCDGVLVDSEIIANKVLSKLLCDFGYIISVKKTRERFVGLSIASIEKIISEEGHVLPKTFSKKLFDLDQIAFKNFLKPIPNMAKTLACIKQPICVASSGSIAKINNSLALTNLTPYFHNKIFSAEMVKSPKPAPDIFLLAATTCGSNPAKCLVVEDSEVGVKGAKRAGMHVFGFFGGKHCGKGHHKKLKSAGADEVFDKMSTLPDLITAL